MPYINHIHPGTPNIHELKGRVGNQLDDLYIHERSFFHRTSIKNWLLIRFQDQITWKPVKAIPNGLGFQFLEIFVPHPWSENLAKLWDYRWKLRLRPHATRNSYPMSFEILWVNLLSSLSSVNFPLFSKRSRRTPLMRNNFDLMSYESFACKWPELKIDSPRFERPPRQAPSSERTTIFSGRQHIGAVPQLFETELMSWHGRNLGKPWYWVEASLPWLSECLPILLGVLQSYAIRSTC